MTETKTHLTWDEIRTHLTSKDRKQRKAIHRFLEFTADESYLPLLYELAVAEDEFDAHFSAAAGIARLEGLSQYLYLIETMADAYAKTVIEDSMPLQTFMEHLWNIAKNYPVPTQKIVTDLLQHPHPFVRGFAVELLGAREDKDVLPSLLSMLHDQDTFVRLNAVEACGLYLFPEYPQVVPALLPLLNDNDEWIRVRVCYRLRIMRNKQQAKEMVIPALKQVSQTDPSKNVRQAATNARRHLDGTEELMSWALAILIPISCGLVAQLFR
jgi:hypothetical protein